MTMATRLSLSISLPRCVSRVGPSNPIVGRVNWSDKMLRVSDIVDVDWLTQYHIQIRNMFFMSLCTQL